MAPTLYNNFRVLGWLEGGSLLLLLFIAMPLKYIAGMPEYVRVVGMAHGLLFVAYCMLAIYLGSENEWSYKKIGASLILSCLPFGTFYFEFKWLNLKN